MAAHDDKEIASLRARLNELEAERGTLSERLDRLQLQAATGSVLNTASASVTGESRAAEKIACFAAYLLVGQMYFLFVGKTAIQESRVMLLRARMSGCVASVASHR